ncbi:MAG: hypothetical protein KJS97_11330 [Alphaproteobacteria bacterium]|nr:hypothetical protein [Alphaproteobacteria bacterium]
MPRPMDNETRDERDDAVRGLRDGVRLAGDQAREAAEAAQNAMQVAGPALAARINDARAMTRSMMETQSRLAIAWVDLAWTPIVAMSRMWRAGQDSGTGHPGSR